MDAASIGSILATLNVCSVYYYRLIRLLRASVALHKRRTMGQYCTAWAGHSS